VTGLVIKPRLASEISNSINSLFDNPKLIESYGENAQKRVLDLFTNEQNTINNLKIYEEITKND
jgi:glycosyltransferase involved in cell wall biosynthesis